MQYPQRLALLLTLFVSAGTSLSACSDEEAKPPADNVWQPTTTPFDPSCETGCQTLRSGEVGHGGGFTLSANPDVDDPIAQWGDCLESFRVCITDGGDAVACSAQSDCPESCKQDFQRQAATAADLEAQLDAFEAVYIEDGAPCRPSSRAAGS